MRSFTDKGKEDLLSLFFFKLGAQGSHLHLSLISSVEDHGHIQPKSSNSGMIRNSDTAFKDTMTKRMCLTLGHLMNDDLHTVLMFKVIFILHS